MFYWLVGFVGLIVAVVAIYTYQRSYQMVILVWNQQQKVPARLYSKAHFGRFGYRVQVCADSNVQLAKLGKKRAQIYNFN